MIRYIYILPMAAFYKGMAELHGCDRDQVAFKA